MPQPPHRRDAVTAALREHGPMTAREIADLIGQDAQRIASIITSNRHQFPGKFFRIADYRQVQGRRARREFVFEASTEPDAKRPTPDPLVARRRRQADYRRRNAARLNARERAKRCAAKGGQVVNPWAQLAPPDMQTYMARVAANTTIREAA